MLTLSALALVHRQRDICCPIARGRTRPQVQKRALIRPASGRGRKSRTLAPPALEGSEPLATVTAVLATTLRIPAEAKLALLAEDHVPERARQLRERMRRLGPVAPPGPPSVSPN